MPPARRPTASIFCDCRSCCSSARRSVTSSAKSSNTTPSPSVATERPETRTTVVVWFLRFHSAVSPLKGCGGAEEIGEVEPLVVIGVETEDVLTDDFAGRGVAEQFEEGRVGVENLAGRVAAADAVGGVRDQRAEVEFRAAQVLLGGAQGCVEPADQHGHKEEQRQADDRSAELLRGMRARRA